MFGLRFWLVAGLAMAGTMVAITEASRGIDTTELVTIGPGSFEYRLAGEFLRDGVPENAPLAASTIARPIAIMRRQVSAAEYAACVADGACPSVARQAGGADRAAVGVSFTDAVAYARWLSQKTGYRYRLPSDAEWAYVAGLKFHDDALPTAGDSRNPATRWLAAYESEAAAVRAIGAEPRPFGSFGSNENGLQDLAGNVWEWTDTCYVRHARGTGGAETRVESCGVRVAEGSHRAYLSDFVRDPRGGACSAGAPPANLGMRLVREDGGTADRLAATLRRFLTIS